jgi:hypothetical protein
MIKLKTLLLENVKSIIDVEQLIPIILSAAQEEYDEWDQSDPDDDELNGGGICQDIAESISDVLNFNGIEATTIDSGGVGDQHVWTVFLVKEGVYELDIPPSLYERGGGYQWTKIQGVTFTKEYIYISKLDIPWEDITNYD